MSNFPDIPISRELTSNGNFTKAKIYNVVKSFVQFGIIQIEELPSLATAISEIGHLLLLSQDMIEIKVNRHKKILIQPSQTESCHSGGMMDKRMEDPNAICHGFIRN